MKRIVVIIPIALACFASTGSACPSCSESVNTPVESTTATNGFNAAIWLMLTAAAVGMGTVAGVLAVSMRARRD